MTTFTIEIEGNALKAAARDVDIRAPLQEILTKYTLLLQIDIASNTPIDKGFLSAGIQPIVEGLVGSVSPIGECKKYAPFVEWDTRPHKIVAKNKPYLHFKTDNGWVRVKEVSHPGTTGHHMFEEGINNVDTDAMLEEISAVLGEAWTG